MIPTLGEAAATPVLPPGAYSLIVSVDDSTEARAVSFLIRVA
jgi:hypothetical protein